MRSLFSAPHKVISGLALVPLSTYAQDVGSDVTTVHPRRMTPEQIATHIAGGSSEVTRRRAEGSLGRGLAKICAIFCVQNVRFRDRIKTATGASRCSATGGRKLQSAAASSDAVIPPKDKDCGVAFRRFLDDAGGA